VAERRAEQVVERHLLLQLEQLIHQLLRAAVQDDAVEVALDGVVGRHG
jgi:hypothetical protein